MLALGWCVVTKLNYGRFLLNRKIVYSHRIAYYLKIGKIPKKKPYILHKPEICHNPSCCNPKHLKAGTQDENNKHRNLDNTQPVLTVN